MAETPTRKFFVRTFGCQMNEHDSQRIAADFVREGLEATDDLEQADVIVLNTCCIRENADNKLYGHLGHLKSLRDRKPDVQIAVGGCLAQKSADVIVKKAPHVDVVFGTHNVGRALELLNTSARTKTSVVEILDEAIDDASAFPSAMAVREGADHAAWVTIQIGCDNSCAFCVVPSVRGKEQSRPFSELIGEISELAINGTTEVTLLGQNVNSYGRDLTMSLRSSDLADEQVADLAGDAWLSSRRARPLFADLLIAIGNVEGIRRVRFTSPHPKDLRPETIAAMANVGAVCEQLHLPMQSGSDAVLVDMRRGYTVERYLAALARARAEIDDLAVTTDLIVGFPGESDRDFEDTLEVVADAGFDGAYTFIFSPRPGTRAETMTDRFVPDDVVAERFARLKSVVDRSSVLKHQARIGRDEEIVIEGESRKDAAVLNGRTRQGKIVHVPRSDELTLGTYAMVRIESAGSHHLRGRVLDIVHRPAMARPARRRIPLSVG